ncbi:MAG: precorrin-4 C(11)-methyltransferase [Syntrophomonadaceae bacterium]|nr:precorrin-4 C(11)-methyltransferase [Syntrophomonadaceae bacterium]MDH7497914.1 precorrin-4 C(11)-methyltransferase [Syntrophomonadaceae bacterium]
MKVYFVGAGPGAPDLITVRGRQLLERCPVVMYAGSLVDRAHLEHARAAVEVHDTSAMTLADIGRVFQAARARDLDVVRLHTGDPSLYGAVREQMELCEELGIEYEVVPGVSSVFAAAAALRVELTVPGGTQTLICSRLQGRTPVPAAENLADLAAHRSSLALFLSVQEMEEVTRQLREVLPATTPVAVVSRVSWPDEQVVRGTLEDIAGRVAAAGIRRTAIILVGDALASAGGKSRLYAEDFHHGYR